MQFGPARRQAGRDSIVPMINVVFLLLVFLLLSAELAPAPPVEIAPPVAEAGDAGAPPGDWVLHIAADGTLALGAARDAAALAAIPAGAVVVLRADAALPAARLAEVLPQLSQAAEIRLVTVAP